MKQSGEKYDTRLYPSDWRYSAAIIGLIRYFDFHGIEFYKPKNTDKLIKQTYIEYNQSDITEERYYEFASYDFDSILKYKRILRFLESKESFNEEDLKTYKELRDTDSKIVKDLLKPIKFDGTNAENIINTIKNNEYEIIKYSFWNGKQMYSNFCNAPNSMDIGFNSSAKEKSSCRLIGYYVNLGKKKKSLCYNFNSDAYDGYDEPEFAFIPFAFSKGGGRPLFVNNNYSVPSLMRMYEQVNLVDDDNKTTSLTNLIATYKNMEKKELTNSNVEIIIKYNPQHNEPDKGYYRTFILNTKSMNIFKNVKMLPFLYSYRDKITDDFSITFFDIFDRIVNGLVFDDMIIKNIKKRYGDAKIKPSLEQIKALIEINYNLYGGNNMDIKQKSAYASSKEVVEVLLKKNAKNKIDTYRNRLTSAMAINSKQKVLELLTNISNYTGVTISIVYDLIEDFETNKNLVYTFIMSLEKDTNKQENNEEKGE